MSPRRPLLSFVIAITLAAHTIAAGAQRPARTGGSSGERSAIVVAGQRRTFLVRTPAAAPAPGAKRPLVIVLHGGGGNALNAEQMSGFTALVEREGLIVVYAEGTGRRATRLLTWNAQHCCGPAMERDVDDVRFLDAMLDTLMARHPIDPRRVYVTGMSNGAMMTHQVGIALSHRIAAIAPVVGALFGDEALPRNPVPAIIFNGMKDVSVPFAGGLSGGVGRRTWDGTPTLPAMEQGRFWARANGCDVTPATERRGSVVLTRYRCPQGNEVELYALTEGGHAWPGGRAGSRRGDRPPTDVIATEVMWTFFKAHVRN
jgi:polyhydroxybutyrate depolymerase